MAQLSNRLQRLAPSATLAMSQKSAEMKAQGIDVINMSVGEPDFNTPDAIKAAAKKAVDEKLELHGVEREIRRDRIRAEVEHHDAVRQMKKDVEVEAKELKKLMEQK